jgi:hypothetical protein
MRCLPVRPAQTLVPVPVAVAMVVSVSVPVVAVVAVVLVSLVSLTVVGVRRALMVATTAAVIPVVLLRAAPA